MEIPSKKNWKGNKQVCFHRYFCAVFEGQGIWVWPCLLSFVSKIVFKIQNSKFLIYYFSIKFIIWKLQIWSIEWLYINLQSNSVITNALEPYKFLRFSREFVITGFDCTFVNRCKVSLNYVLQIDYSKIFLFETILFKLLKCLLLYELAKVVFFSPYLYFFQ
jgi:hypothetical protein